MAQDAPSPFPRITLGISGGPYKPALNELKARHRKDPMIGVHLTLRLFNLAPRHGIYGVVQWYSFHAVKLGTDAPFGSSAIRVQDWELDTVNGGIRYAIHLFGGGDLSWLGGGVSSIWLDRIVRTTRFEQDGAFSRKEVREETRDRLRSTSYYVEIGQLVQSFVFKAQPRVGFFWNAKWDRGQYAAESTGGLSLQAGVLIGL